MPEKNNINSLPLQTEKILAAHFIVGIGASAGGLQALEDFFSGLPPEPNTTFVVVQHLSPDFRSLMVELLQRRTVLPVSVIEDGIELQLNHVYVLPIGFMVSLVGQRLVLEQCTDRATDYPINHFFSSLAKEKNNRAIGILLSGTGKDGTEGLKDISRVGGVALVQSKDTAQFDAMPTNPISSGLVDEILSPTDLAQAIADIVHYASTQAAEITSTDPILQPQQLAQILDILQTQEGVDFSRYKPGTLNRRIIHRLLLSHIVGVEKYIAYIQETPAEVKNLRQDLLIGSTRFFRDAKMWALLQTEVLPPLIERLEPDQPLRIWVAACSTGEEAYSMAIAVTEVMEKLKSPHLIKLFATDIDQEALAIASRGTYSAIITNNISPTHLEKYFNITDKEYTIKKSIRSQVIFASHDLTKNPGFSHMHLVSCRNMLIYLQPSLQEQVIKLLHFSLAPNRALILGPSESLGSLDYAFNSLNLLWKFYQKRQNIQLPINEMNRSRMIQPIEVLRPIKANQSQYDHLLASVFKLRFGALASTCVLVNANYQTQHIFLNTANLLEFALGEINVNILEIVLPSLKLPLSTALHRVVRHQEPVIYSNIQVSELKEYCVNLWVGFVGETESSEKNMIVLFELEAIPADKANQNITNLVFDPNQDLSQRVRELEYELQQTRDNLQATIEKLETANEEQQATNEEGLASNEELQSTNEELQSVNEELYTVNSENQARIKQLTELSADMDNLLRSINIGVVFLDHELNIRKYTPAATTVFNVRFTDIGRPLSELVNSLDISHLMTLVQQVGEDGKAQEVEATNMKTGDHLLLRILPYFREDNSINGVVITLIAINDLKQTQQALVVARDKAERAVRAKSTFLANMSHEIRTPINGVLGMLQLMELSDLSLEQRSQIQTAKVSANILLNVINDILDYSKIEADELRIQSINFDLREKLGAFTKTFSLVAEEKGLQLILDMVDVPHALVKGDPNRIQQIWTNLINNAIKFTAEGEILIRATLQPQGEQLRLTTSIIDTGIGIAADDLGLLFAEFAQLDNGATRKYGGTGLGLAISQKLCERMGGIISVESELGEGSCFEFTVLLDASEEVLLPLPHLSEMNVLVVDGNATRREILCRQLRQWGLKAMPAASGAIAFDLCEEEADNLFDLVLLDERMPDMDGVEFSQCLQLDSCYQDIAVVMMTSINSSCDRKPLNNLGLASCLSKLITPDELWQVLSQIDVKIQERKRKDTDVEYISLPSNSLDSDLPEDLQELKFKIGSITAPLLFAEDNKMNQFVLEEVTQLFGLNCSFVDDGAACIESLIAAPADLPFELIVMDCMMPEMDGYEATRRIRAGEAGERYLETPIIAMTANAMKGDREDCLQAGMSDYLMKPIEIRSLLKMLEKWLGSPADDDNAPSNNNGQS
ncbi:MAG: CheR family methyltransferase [Limnothrix sp.]